MNYETVPRDLKFILSTEKPIYKSSACCLSAYAAAIENPRDQDLLPAMIKGGYMICIELIPCLSSGLVKLCSYLSYFPGFLAILKVWLFFHKWGTNLTPKKSNRMF